MSIPPPQAPNDTLAQLEDILGSDDVRDLARTYLKEFDGLIRTLASAEGELRHRTAHALKSSSRHMGLMGLARRFEALEARLLLPEGQVTADDLATITQEYERTIPPLRKYVQGK